MRECKKTSRSEQTDTHYRQIAGKEAFNKILEAETNNRDWDTADEYLDHIPEVLISAESEETLAKVAEEWPKYHYRTADCGGMEYNIKLKCVITFKF